MESLVLFKVIVMFAIILLPLIFSPKNKRVVDTGISKYAVNRRGYLEHYIGPNLDMDCEEDEGGILV